MLGYAVNHIFSADDLVYYKRAMSLVEDLPEYEGLRLRTCHQVAAYVAEALGVGVTVETGRYGIIDHSWCRLPSGTLLDVYAPGRHPMVQLVDANTVTTPESSSYRKEGS